ncbi:DUF1343 domain-containing protein [Phycicoccus endophyticus]|uniref:DUF1343 domain-containing protein n=1 Tax=Phycicoccus endophyticus TaxID=1690220 RepID=A0A7G9R042_9MICO|nr:DUF1343 domain-containing protein [Phycicoccus endophyticus]QNN48967.1 DUF1343 domain-containing protein [Phycicoccus endophyticus]GGL45736.1 hypothetical protein GCM10012283_30450 [Phycicoccus endophyticus]
MTLDRRQLFAASAASAAGAAATAVAAAPSAWAGGHHPTRKRPVTPGADRAAAEGWRVLAGRAVGVVTNPTGILTNLHSIVDEMVASGSVDVRGVFGPEHGFRGTAQAGDSEDTYVDERTGVTVYDAYGATVDAFAAMMRDAGVDTVVFDIQDVGARFYTYIWTMYSAMRAAVRVGASFVVLDRPNPVGGTARGPMMTPAFTSGVGAKEIVQAHGMTVGELAGFFDGEFLEGEEGARLERLDVVQVKGWRRDVTFDGTDLPWVMPSPNMPTPDTALVYPGTCLFEGTNLSEGRGTTRPFELVGAPFVDHRWAERLAGRDVPGVAFREAYFTPTFSKHQGEVCGGVQVHIEDPGAVDGPRLGAEMLVAAKALYGSDFAWRTDSWDSARPYWVDKLTGSPRLREMVDAGAPADEVVGAWRSELAAFERTRRQYLLYPGPGR